MAAESIGAAAGVGEGEEEEGENGGDGGEDTELERGGNGVFGENRERLQRAAEDAAERGREQRGEACGSLVQQACEIGEPCGANRRPGTWMKLCLHGHGGRVNAGWFSLCTVFTQTVFVGNN
ncbi:uncharacterized protein LOC111013277 [Momordica charantia]|uniref:Uncharacterized protein LOC111013277 n=1 Tax=Momordica charantia TaxID=3673 RepID=A0A6J1CQL7_MOMCH|nr:uncharacterized protein LOC111013277 [Momordica charantia]